MYPTTTTLTDTAETTPDLQTLSGLLEEAVAQAEPDRIRHLMFQRNHALHRAAGDTTTPLSPARRAELLAETRRWLATLQAHQQRIEAELARLRTRRNTKRTLFRAYRPALPTTHGLRRHG
jgi:hypothetical protein